jgi:hypothetical protein
MAYWPQPKNEAQNPKSETNSNEEAGNVSNARMALWSFKIRALNLFRASCFRFRVSVAKRACSAAEHPLRYTSQYLPLSAQEPPMSRPICSAALALLAATFVPLLAEEPVKKDATPSREELVKKLEETLTGAKLTGAYSVAGREDRAPKAEEYTITSATKLPEGDVWLIKARIKYGDKDTTIPMPLEIKWAGDTPIITLTNMAIPGLGTFTARVLIYDNRYAGTWQHGPVGGNLFGKIEKAKDNGDAK